MEQQKKRVIFLKQSGERLASGEFGWAADSVQASAEKLAAVHNNSKQLGVAGLVLVSGGGNIIRGDKLKKDGIAPKHADQLGRLATIINSVIVAEALRGLGIETKIFIAPSMAYKDGEFELEPYSAERLSVAFSKNRLVLIAGGSGEDNVTTDYAVAFYAGDYYKHYKETEVRVLKGTKWDGVFEQDPAKNPNTRRYKLISAKTMLDDYRRFAAVDERSLKEVIGSNLEMLVYADGEHSLEDVIRRGAAANNEAAIGTLIVPQDVKPLLY